MFCWSEKSGPKIFRAIGILFLLLAASAGAAGDTPAGKLVVGKNADSRLEIFQVDSRGELRHRWQKVSTGDWSAWINLGGDVLPGIAVADDARGRMEVFAVDRASKTLKCVRQQETNSTEWSDWVDLGGAVEPPLAVGRNADGRLEVFARDAATLSTRHCWQTNADGAWSTWTDLGGAAVSDLAIAQNTDGRLELFAIETGARNLVHCWQRQAGASGPWSAWEDLGGKILPGFVVGKNFLGRLEVFGVGASGAVRRICQNASGGSGWSAWQNFGGNVSPGLSIGQCGVGRLEILAVNAADSMLLHRWELFNDGSDKWSAWAGLGAAAQPPPAVMANEDGDLEVFALDPTDSNRVLHRRQISSASDWLDWSSLDKRSFQYASRLWQLGDGLPDNLVTAIAQTPDGWLWVGTRAGLARFDGVEFFSYDVKTTPELKNSSITALCADRQGALWIGTDGGGLVCFKNGAFVNINTNNGLAGSNVRVIFESRDGTLWIGTTTGVSRYKSGAFRTYTKADGLLSDVVTHIYEDRDGDLWIATGKGLNRLRSGGAMDSFTMPDGLPNDSVRGICQDKGGRIWIGSNNGLLWYDWFWGNHFYAYNTRYGLSDTFVSAICEDHEGNLWVGTYSGLNRFREGRFYSQRDNEGAPFGRVNAMLEDREGDLWVGSNEGLIRLTPKRFVTYTKQQGLTHNNVTSVMQDQNGSLWIGTWGGGLDRLKDEKVTAYAPTNGLSQDLILSLCAGRNGTLWVGADFDGGLTGLKDGKIVHYTWKDGLINAGLRVLREDRDGNLWIGTSRGLCRFKDGAFTNYENLSNDDVRAICEDRAGNLWFGTENGLVRLKAGKFTVFTTTDGLSDDTITALYEDRDGVLWIGTENGGLNCYKDNQFKVYTTKQGLFSNEIFSILDDDNGWIWVTCSRGIFRSRKQDFGEYDAGRTKIITSIAYGKTDGMETPQCSGAGQPSAWKSADGRLWFATSKGLATVDPATLIINRRPPQVYIEQLIADKKRRMPQHGAISDVPLRIPPGRGELEFQYAALSLSAPEKNHYKYKLQSVDPDWVDAGARRTANYNNISPGSYRFQVIACDKDGVWNQSGASLAVILEPHYFQTWWFRGLIGLMIIGGATGAALTAARRRMLRRLQQLEQRHAIEKERGRIAKDIHDDLGSSLTRIMMLGERAEEGLLQRSEIGPHIRKMVTFARHSVQSLDEIVWAVNPENDTLNGLVEYVGHYADEFFENTNVRCRLEIPLELPALNLPAETRHNLFLVVKEAFNNALKHSGASEVRVRISADAANVEIGIEDNGCGFEPDAGSNGSAGNGLQNMRRRIEHLGGHFKISSAPGKGTTLDFAMSLHPDAGRR